MEKIYITDLNSWDSALLYTETKFVDFPHLEFTCEGIPYSITELYTRRTDKTGTVSVRNLQYEKEVPEVVLDFTKFPKDQIAQKWFIYKGEICFDWCFCNQRGQPVMLCSDYKVRTKPIDMEGWVKLDTGNWLFNYHSKYRFRITFISSKPMNLDKWVKVEPAVFNLPKGNIQMLEGKFFISKKGSPCFDMTGVKTHVLIVDSWGGSCSKDRGRTLPQSQSVHFERIQSNGGGIGADYGVFPIDWKYKISVDDI